MEQKSKTYIRPIVIVMIFVFLTIGYAYLTSALNINGATLLKKPTWDVHFENVQVKDGSVTGDQVTQEPEIDTDRTTVSFHINLKKPGDYYEFTVDAVNAGTIDAMINTITDFDLTEDQLKYLETSVTYEDGEEVQEKQQLLAGDFAVYKIVVSFKKDISKDDLPSTPDQLDLTYSVEYVQKDSSSRERFAETHLLYNVLKREAESDSGLAKLYTGEHQDSIDASKSNKRIYSWYSSSRDVSTTINNMNNVVFAGHCWQMFRTTDTGGVKLLYNGISVNNQCIDGRGPHPAYSGDSGKTSVTLNSNYYYGTDFNYDTDSQKYFLSGDITLAKWSDSSYTELVGKYTCRSNDSSAGCDKLYLIESYKNSTSADAFILITSNSDHTIGSLMFNKKYTNVESVGYMYGDDYNRQGHAPSGSSSIGQYYNVTRKKEISSIDANILFSDSYNCRPGSSYSLYSLISPVTFDSFESIDDIIGKYTIWVTDSGTSSAAVSYVLDIIGDYVYYKSLVDGNALSIYEPMYISNSAPTKSNDSYYFSNYTEVLLYDWIRDYASYNKKYVCIGSNPCTDPIFITSTTDTRLDYISAKDKITFAKSYEGLELIDTVTLTYPEIYNDYSDYSDYKYSCGNTSSICTKDNLKYYLSITSNAKLNFSYYTNHYYASSVSWDGEKYKLNDYVGLEESSNTNLIDTHRFMCVPFNEKTCSSVAYIYRIGSGNYSYITLTNGQTTLSDAFSGMFDNNINSSFIKKGIDNWYERYLLDYSDYLDDIIYCNDRRMMYNRSWTPGYQDLSDDYIRYEVGKMYSPSSESEINLKCQRVYDSFSVSNPDAKLKYPIGLIELNEARLTSKIYGVSAYFFADGAYFWTMSPDYSCRNSQSYSGMHTITADGAVGNPAQTSMTSGTGVRPVISLKSGTSFSIGNGSKEKPYYIGKSYKVSIDNNIFTVKPSAAPGDVVSIYSDDYVVTSFKLNGNLINGESFIMSDVDAIITDITYVAANYSIENNNSNIVVPTIGRYKTIIKIRSNDDFVISSFKLNGEIINGDSFIMPSQDVVISDVVIANYIVIESKHNPYDNNHNYKYFDRSFDGASSISVELTYQTESLSFDYVSIYKSENDTSPLKYGGSTLTATSVDLDSNYIKIYFRTDNSGNNYYGFKAIITPNYD